MKKENWNPGGPHLCGNNRRLSIELSLTIFLLFISSLLVGAQTQLRESAAASTSTTTSSTTTPPLLLLQSLTLPMGYFQYFEIDSFSNSTWVVYGTSSNASISTAFMTYSQFSLFANTSSDEISNSMTYHNGTSDRENLQIAPGRYFLVFYAYFADVNVSFAYQVYPSTPFSYGAVSAPQPSGIASFGIYNDSGNVVPYEIKTSEIVGITNISSLLAYNPTAPQYGNNIAGTTLQLNAMLTVIDKNGSQYTYWCQNVPDFVTNVSMVSFGDQIWNNTDLIGSMSNQTVTSTNFQNGGFVSPTNLNGTSQFAYSYAQNNVTYKFPFNIALLMNETLKPGKGVLLQMGLRILANGYFSSASPVYWFDNVTIHDTRVQNAYFDVSGNSTTPLGNYYDAELVFAGEGNLQSTTFTQMNATVGLFYRNGSSSVLTSFPSYYSFGGDTGEPADNLVITYSNGIAQVGVGNPNYAYLGSASLTLDPNSMTYSPSATKTTTSFTVSFSRSSISSSSSLFSTSSAASSKSSGFTTSSSSLSTGSSSSSSSNSLGFLPIAAGLVILVIVLLSSVVLISRRHRPIPPPPESFVGSQSQVGSQTCPNCGTILPHSAVFCGNCGKSVASR